MHNRIRRFRSGRLKYSLTAAAIALAGSLACSRGQAGPLQDGDLVLITAEPGDIPIGYLVYDIIFPGDFGEFDIVNQTGANNSLPAPDFPVVTTVLFSDLDLMLQFSDGSTKTFDLSDFSLSADGQSLDGPQFAVGGASPQPVAADLTGTLNTTSIMVGSPPVTETIDSAIAPASLGSPVVPTVPEPDMSLIFLVGSFMVVIFSRRLHRRHNSQGFATAAGLGGTSAAVFTLAAMMFPAICAAASVSVKQNTWVTPDTGVAGVSFLNVTASSVPSGTISPGNVTIKVAPTCTVSASAPVAGEVDATAASVTKIIGSTDRFNFEIPASLAQGTYFAQVVDTTDGFAGGNCSMVKVTTTKPTLNACVPTSSLGVVAGTTVTAFVPNGWWGGSATGIVAVPIEGGGSNTSIPTPHVVNSCAGNPATGQAVCTGNNTDVYLISGSPPALTNTLTSGLSGFASFSGGSCTNCGVAVNALTNTAAIAGGSIGSPSGDGVQILGLNTNTFGPVFKTTQRVSEDISIDPGRNLILSPNESNNYPLLSLNAATGAVTGEFDRAITTGGEPDSAAEDCSTGIALSSVEAPIPGHVYMADLSQATFTSGSPGSWTSPFTLFTLTGTSSFVTGISVAQGSSHLAVVSGEFGANTFGVLQLQSASGTGGSAPTLPDYVSGLMPPTPDGVAFLSGCDPHTVTAYTSPNTGVAIGLYVGWTSGCGIPKWIGVIDLAKALAAARTAGTHMIAPGVNLITSGVLTYVKIQ
jgi:hypothetical protein